MKNVAGIEALLDVYLTETWYDLPAVIVLPGGGYTMHATQEAAPIAEFYRNRGFHAFVLRYRTLPEAYPAALCDVQDAIRYIRANSGRLKVDPNNIYVIGFSAGGHLAALSAVSDRVCPSNPVLDAYSHVPNGVVLGYPVISSRLYCGCGCIQEFCRGEDRVLDTLSIDCRVTSDTPPFFVWHTFEDDAADVRHTLALGMALKESNVPFEMHIFPSGKHGLGLAKLDPGICAWPEWSVRWLLSDKGQRKN